MTDQSDHYIGELGFEHGFDESPSVVWRVLAWRRLPWRRPDAREYRISEWYSTAEEANERAQKLRQKGDRVQSVSKFILDTGEKP